MDHDFDLTGYLDGTLSKTETNRINEHLKLCNECREDLANFKKSIHLFSEILEKYPDFSDQMNQDMDEHLQTTSDYPLPDVISELLDQKKKQTALEKRFDQALNVLSSSNFRLYPELVRKIECITQKLKESEYSKEPVFSLNRDITMPLQTELELRHISGETACLNIEGTAIEITKAPGNVRVKITRNNQPVRNMEIKLKNGSEVISTVRTDDNGSFTF
jgi:hypothetical protein